MPKGYGTPKDQKDMVHVMCITSFLLFPICFLFKFSVMCVCVSGVSQAVPAGVCSVAVLLSPLAPWSWTAAHSQADCLYPDHRV